MDANEVKNKIINELENTHLNYKSLLKIYRLILYYRKRTP